LAGVDDLLADFEALVGAGRARRAGVPRREFPRRAVANVAQRLRELRDEARTALGVAVISGTVALAVAPVASGQ